MRYRRSEQLQVEQKLVFGKPIEGGIENMIEACKELQKRLPHLSLLLKLGSKGRNEIYRNG